MRGKPRLYRVSVRCMPASIARGASPYLACGASPHPQHAEQASYRACGARPTSTGQVSGTPPPGRIRSGPRPRSVGLCPTRGLAGERRMRGKPRIYRVSARGKPASTARGASPVSGMRCKPTSTACGASLVSSMRGEAHIHSMRSKPCIEHAGRGPHAQARFRKRRRPTASGRGHGLVGVGLAPHGALPGNAACGASPASTGAACGASPHPQHALQAPHLARGARHASTGQVSRASPRGRVRSGPRRRRCGACLTRGPCRGKPHAGQAPHPQIRLRARRRRLRTPARSPRTARLPKTVW